MEIAYCAVRISFLNGWKAVVEAELFLKRKKFTMTIPTSDIQTHVADCVGFMGLWPPTFHFTTNAPIPNPKPEVFSLPSPISPLSLSLERGQLEHHAPPTTTIYYLSTTNEDSSGEYRFPLRSTVSLASALWTQDQIFGLRLPGTDYSRERGPSTLNYQKTKTAHQAHSNLTI